MTEDEILGKPSSKKNQEERKEVKKDEGSKEASK